MKLKTTALITAGLSLALVAGTASAVKPDDAVDYRQGAFQVFKWNMGPMGAMASGDMPFDSDLVAKHAEQLNRVADMPWQGFTDDSNISDSDALPAVWSNRARFDELAREFEKAAADLNALAQAGAGQSELRGAIGAVGRACRTCHDDFKED